MDEIIEEIQNVLLEKMNNVDLLLCIKKQSNQTHEISDDTTGEQNSIDFKLSRKCM